MIPSVRAREVKRLDVSMAIVCLLFYLMFLIVLAKLDEIQSETIRVKEDK